MKDPYAVATKEIASRILRHRRDPRITWLEDGLCAKVRDDIVMVGLKGTALRRARAILYSELDRILVKENQLKHQTPGTYCLG